MNLLYRLGQESYKGNLSDKERIELRKLIIDLQLIVNTFGKDFFGKISMGRSSEIFRERIRDCF